MADDIQLKKITELSESANATDGNLFAIGDETSGNLKKITTKSLSESLLGDADISDVADGTVKGAISAIRKGEVDTADSIVTFESGDDESPTAWTDVSLVKSGETHSSLFNKLSTMVKNVRWILSRLGNTDISSIGDGTVTNSIFTNAENISANAENISKNASDITSLNSALTELLTSDTFSVNMTVSANNTAVIDFNIGKSGYNTLGIIGYRCTNSNMLVYRFDITSNSAAQVYLRNTATTDGSPTVELRVLYIKS